jgi:class 3 adenylate cyclase/CheY-like chemotaxis protein
LSGELDSNLLTDHVLEAMAGFRDHCESARPTLDDHQKQDMDKLGTTSSALEALLANDSLDLRQKNHDLRNVLGAMRGYAELLGEELGPDNARMLQSLQQLLKAISSATAEGSEPATASRIVEDKEAGTILAVDDSAENRDLLERYLSRMGHQVLTASTGQMALDTLAVHEVDLVLLDLIMPGMDGSEVLNSIKSNPAWRATPVIVISGQQDMDGIISCIEAGADDYMFKPFNPVLLQARIKAGLERKRWHDREQRYREQLERNEKFIRATFGRYVSEEVVVKLLEEPEGLKLGGDLREVTILMSDIRSFSTICEQLPADKVMHMLNNYLGTMSDIIIGHQGTIDEFIGDAILAIFGAPISREDDADRAVRCALEMQEAMHAINRENQSLGLPEIAMGIGINTGAVIAGNIGSEKRSKYGVVGHQVNLTSRIEGKAKGGEILVSQTTLDQLSTPQQVDAPRTVRVKGINKEVSIYRITCRDQAQ